MNLRPVSTSCSVVGLWETEAPPKHTELHVMSRPQNSAIWRNQTFVVAAVALACCVDTNLLECGSDKEPVWHELLL